MKKIFLTLAICFTTLLASAQFTMVSSIDKPADNESWGVSNFTDNMGMGYQATDKIMVGVTKGGDNYNLFARYSMGDFYIMGEMDSTDNMSWGVGYSIKFWNELYIEPNYTMGDDEGEFKIGMAYRF
jgi:hypothetical protein|tara:strand:+ start:5505 stop:5885 length:381 start_codon:yes stop_codon:yes gene_type:complete